MKKLRLNRCMCGLCVTVSVCVSSDFVLSLLCGNADQAVKGITVTIRGAGFNMTHANPLIPRCDLC